MVTREFFVMPYGNEKPHLFFWKGAWWIKYHMRWCDRCYKSAEWLKKKNKEAKPRAINCNGLIDG